MIELPHNLPIRAYVAIATRATLRVLPLIRRAAIQVSPVVVDIDQALSLAQKAAEGDDWNSIVVERADAAFNDEPPDALSEAEREVLKAAHRSLSTVAAICTNDNAAAESRAAQAIEFADRAAVAMGTDGTFEFSTKLDIALASAATVTEGWAQDGRIPLSFFGPLFAGGELWLAPPERGAQPKELILTFEVPESLTDDDVLRLVSETVREADRVHRAYGGHGLMVDQGDISVDREIVAPCPEGVPS
jgi:hypothetical protein